LIQVLSAPRGLTRCSLKELLSRPTKHHRSDLCHHQPSFQVLQGLGLYGSSHNCNQTLKSCRWYGHGEEWSVFGQEYRRYHSRTDHSRGRFANSTPEERAGQAFPRQVSMVPRSASSTVSIDACATRFGPTQCCRPFLIAKETLIFQ